MFGKDKKVSDFVDTWWWRGLRVLYGALIVIAYVWIASSEDIFVYVDSFNELISDIVLSLFLVFLVALGAFILRTITYYVIEGGSEETKKSFKYTLWTLLFSVIALIGGAFINSQISDNTAEDQQGVPIPPPTPERPSLEMEGY